MTVPTVTAIPTALALAAVPTAARLPCRFESSVAAPAATGSTSRILLRSSTGRTRSSRGGRELTAHRLCSGITVLLLPFALDVLTARDPKALEGFLTPTTLGKTLVIIYVDLKGLEAANLLVDEMLKSPITLRNLQIIHNFSPVREEPLKITQ